MKLRGIANSVHVENLCLRGQNWKLGIMPISVCDASPALCVLRHESQRIDPLGMLVFTKAESFKLVTLPLLNICL